MTRPTSYTKELVDAICIRLSNGESLNAITKNEEMPDRATVFRWLVKHKQFCDQYRLARMAQADFFIDEIIDIVDDEGDDPKNKRIRFDARRWIFERISSSPSIKHFEQMHSSNADKKWVIEFVNSDFKPSKTDQY